MYLYLFQYCIEFEIVLEFIVTPFINMSMLLLSPNSCECTILKFFIPIFGDTCFLYSVAVMYFPHTGC